MPSVIVKLGACAMQKTVMGGGSSMEWKDKILLVPVH